jgi:hypothetical protein
MTAESVTGHNSNKMSSSLVFKLSIALLLPLTLAWKLSVRPGDPAELAQKDKAAQLRIAEFLTRQHFSVTVADSMPEGQPSIRASAGACRLLIAETGVRAHRERQ